MILRVDTIKQGDGKVIRTSETIGKKETKVPKPKKPFFRKAERTGFQLGRSAGEFGKVGARQEEPFSREQEAMQGMFGHGEKIWGTIGEPVQINNDLNPRQRGDRGTAELFGF